VWANPPPLPQVYTNAIDSLSDDDKKLPQVEALLPLLRRGIGIHHGGLLPILKEIVEILFSEGLIKCLFATETFSIGINMPAKTVVFTNCRKWDGTANRWVTSGEYIQMSGRAGRRGKDDRGIVIQMMDEKMEPAVCKGILYGDPDPLNSSYHISYNMLLNMMRVEEVDPEFLIKASFHQYQQESEAPLFEAQAEEFENAAAQIEIIDGELVGQYFGMKKQLRQIQDNTMDIVRDPANIRKFLQVSPHPIHTHTPTHMCVKAQYTDCRLRTTGSERDWHKTRCSPPPLTPPSPLSYTRFARAGWAAREFVRARGGHQLGLERRHGREGEGREHPR